MSKHDNKEIRESATIKPPIGLLTQWRHRELRIDEINNAIMRYDLANHPIPHEWLEEKTDHLNWLHKHLPSSPYVEGYHPPSEGSGEVGLRWVKASSLPKELPDVVVTMMPNGRMFAYNTNHSEKGLQEVIKHKPDILCLCVYRPDHKEYTLPSNVEGRRFTEGEVYELLNMAIVASRDKSFTNLPDWWDKNIKK